MDADSNGVLPGRMRKNSSDSFAHGQTALLSIHMLGQFLRIWSFYAAYEYLTESGLSAAVFLFICLLLSSILFLFIQQPWKGRPLSNSQVVTSVINGGILALSVFLWGKGLESCGPVRTALSEYAGAVFGVLSGFLYGRKGKMWRKIAGLMAMMASFFILSKGWSTASHFPFQLNGEAKDLNMFEEGHVGFTRMIIPIMAGILSALRRVVARRVSLKSQWKRRLHAITVASATCFFFPFAIWNIGLGKRSNEDNNSIHFSWAYVSTVLFGIVFSYFIESMAEDRLHLVASSPRHLATSAVCIIVLEQFYKMNFSLLGFLICSSVLGLGMFEATSLEVIKKDFVHMQHFPSDDSNDPSAQYDLPS